MWSDVIEHKAIVVHGTVDNVTRLIRIQFWFVRRQVFTPVEVPRMIYVHMLTPRQRSPRDESLNVDAPGRVCAAFIDHPCPARGYESASHLASQVEEVHANPSDVVRQIGELQARALFFVFEGRVGDFAVRLRRHGQQHVGRI